MTPPDRTAAHVAAIRECATIYMQGKLGRTVTGVGIAWDIAALTRVVEQIAAEAVAPYKDRCAKYAAVLMVYAPGLNIDDIDITIEQEGGPSVTL